MSFGTRIRELRLAKGMTGTELGAIVGVGRGSVSSWENDATRPDSDRLPILAAVLGTTVDHLLSESGAVTTGKSKPLFSKSNVKNPARLSPNAPATESAGELLPLITWEQVASWGGQVDTTTAVKEWLPCDIEHSALAFWLEVVGISMYVPGEELSFREGDLIAVDPKREAAHGNFVLASVDGELYLRQLIVDGKTKFLKAIAPGWPNALTVLRKDDRLVGTVIKLAPKTKVLV